MKEIEELYNKLKEINYGWHDKDGIVHDKLINYRELFRLSDSNDVLKDNYGVCWELCEIQRKFFNEKKIPNKTIFAYLNKSKNNACHTFSVFYLNDKVYWFEASWHNQKGIHEFNNLEEILDFYRNNFYDFARVEYNKDDMTFFEYDDVEKGMTTEDFYKHCLSSKKI